ncbi:serine protease 27-like isoform X2 [Hyperolius riggenbachi]|uniref:serine protease 27-like isoform X2 n=1 Tax=Hyperolius riggenbachi TaxID=752182 RepID=UPI0035A384B2
MSVCVALSLSPGCGHSDGGASSSDDRSTAGVCGSPMPSGRIVNGSDALEGEWPWQVYVYYKSGSQSRYCGGSLLTTEWVLSAAHCFTDPDERNYLIIIGTIKLSQLTDAIHHVTQIIVPPYRGNVGDPGDIALVQLSSPVSYTKNIMPICLPSSNVTFPCGMECWVTGWGRLEFAENVSLPDTLQKLMVPLIDHSTCAKLYDVINEDRICAGYKEGQKDFCMGDSGGPLVCKVQGIWYQVGIVSFIGVPCGLPNKPGVYTSVTYYEQWIRRYIRDLTFTNLSDIPEPSVSCAGNTDVPNITQTMLLLAASVLGHAMYILWG